MGFIDTPNFTLKKPDLLQTPYTTEVNDNFDIIDTEMQANQDAAAAAAASQSPIGAVINWTLDVEPSGHLECDGAAISRTVFSELFAIIGTDYGIGDGSTTFNLPDYQGLILRGRGTNSFSELNNANVANVQQDKSQGHHHKITSTTQNLFGATDGVGTATDIGTGTAGNLTLTKVDDPVIDGSNGTPRTGSETAPSNITVMYCIKFE